MWMCVVRVHSSVAGASVPASDHQPYLYGSQCRLSASSGLGVHCCLSLANDVSSRRVCIILREVSLRFNGNSDESFCSLNNLGVYDASLNTPSFIMNG